MKKFLVFMALVAVVALGLFIAGLYRPYAHYSGTLIVEIPPGTSALEVAKILVERGVLEFRAPFLFRYALGRPRNSLKAGEYSFDRPLRPIDVYRKMVEGEVRLFTVVIPEGSDRFDMANIFHDRLGIDPNKFLRLTQTTAVIRDLDPQAPTLEGYLFPDTYRFAKNATAARVVEIMLARERQVLKEKFAVELNDPGQDLHDVVTLASLVEKETPEPSERPLVAGVFARRLKIGLPLACDPTVIYAARLDGRMLEHPLPPIYESDLQFKSPYNTYLHGGLPPGPIASPGEASLRAAFHPAPGDALYFVSNLHGGHIFAKTLAEHLRNVARYRRQVAEIRRQESQSTDKSKEQALKSRGGNGTTKKSAQRARH